MLPRGGWTTMRRVSPAALVLALHAELLDLLTSPVVESSTIPIASGVHVALYLPAGASAVHPRRRPRRFAAVRPPARAGTGGALVRVRGSIPPRALLQRGRSLGRPIRWLRALQREAQVLTARRSPAGVRFGFARSSAFASAATAYHWGGWDYAATRRIETLPVGRTVIARNDRCSLAIAPLPIVGCWLGRAPVAGDLFTHMRICSSGRLP